MATRGKRKVTASKLKITAPKPDTSRQCEKEQDEDTASSLVEKEEAFDRELLWCIEKLSTMLQSGKLTDKQAASSQSTLQSLQGTKVPFIKKRLLMRATFGDYRSKIEQEQAECDKRSRQVKIKCVDSSQTSSQFIRKSSKCLEQDNKTSSAPEENKTNFRFIPSENNFRFNFNETTDEKSN